MVGLRPIGAAAAATARQSLDTAQSLVGQNMKNGRLDADGLARDLAAATKNAPSEARTLRQAVDSELTPVQRGELASKRPSPVDVKTLALDVGQVALDIVGIFEPTPFADLTNAGISVLRGDVFGAVTSAAGTLPYVGDLAKAGKLGKWAQTAGRAVDAALASPAAMRLLSGPLNKLSAAVRAIPGAVLARAPGSVRDAIAGLRSQLDRVATPIAREVGAAVSSTAHRLGIPEGRLRAVVNAPHGSRPPVSTYMTAAQRAVHLAAFDGGIVRFTSSANYKAFGTLGPNGGFVTSAREFDAIVKEARGDLSTVESRLGLMRGALRHGDTMIVIVKRSDAPSLRLPNGNEDGVNDKWVPGGYTSGRVIEAVAEFPKGTPFREIKL